MLYLDKGENYRYRYPVLQIRIPTLFYYPDTFHLFVRLPVSYIIFRIFIYIVLLVLNHSFYLGSGIWIRDERFLGSISGINIPDLLHWNHQNRRLLV
jgi:hypothetical protein